jgi:biotin transport system substrate-specific component
MLQTAILGMGGALGRLRRARYEAFVWRDSLAITQKIALALGVAAATGLLAQVRFYLPWTAVPVTGQTFAVLLAGVLLGGGWGAISQIAYVALGAAGIPWFAGWSGGSQAFLGPTGGYLLGFVLAALLIGGISDRFVKARSLGALVALMAAANLLIYAAGLLHLRAWLGLSGQAPSLSALLWMGMIPFLAGDVLKILAAASIAAGITPKESFRQ